jgi:hypothetical protein
MIQHTKRETVSQQTDCMLYMKELKEKNEQSQKHKKKHTIEKENRNDKNKKKYLLCTL